MNSFTWAGIKKNIDTAYEVGDDWLVTLICQHNHVVTIYREPFQRLSDCPPIVSNAQSLIDIQRILSDDFWGNIFIEGNLGDITRVWKREVKKP
jgi:hypothetical protein